MEYRICEEDSSKQLQSRVNQLIAQGWEPLGGLSVAQSQQSGKWWYYQAMTRATVGSEAIDSQLKSSFPRPDDLE